MRQQTRIQETRSFSINQRSFLFIRQDHGVEIKWKCCREKISAETDLPHEGIIALFMHLQQIAQLMIQHYSHTVKNGFKKLWLNNQQKSVNLINRYFRGLDFFINGFENSTQMLLKKIVTAQFYRFLTIKFRYGSKKQNSNHNCKHK